MISDDGTKKPSKLKTATEVVLGLGVAVNSTVLYWGYETFLQKKDAQAALNKIDAQRLELKQDINREYTEIVKRIDNRLITIERYLLERGRNDRSNDR